MKSDDMAANSSKSLETLDESRDKEEDGSKEEINLTADEEDVLLVTDEEEEEEGQLDSSAADESNLNGSKEEEDDDVIEVPSEYGNDEEEDDEDIQRLSLLQAGRTAAAAAAAANGSGGDTIEVNEVSDSDDDGSSGGLMISQVQGGVGVNDMNGEVDEDDVLVLSGDDEEVTSSSMHHRQTDSAQGSEYDDVDEDVMEIDETDPLQSDHNMSMSSDGVLDLVKKNPRRLDPSHASPVENGDCDSSENEAGSENTNNHGSKTHNNNTIVVNDTKSLVDLANSKKEPGKEPTLVIIDTNALMAGRGAVPVSRPPALHQQPNLSQQQSKGKGSNPGGIDIPDDAYLIEAPSFIVPYVFEQSGEKSLKETIKKIAEQIKAQREEKLAKGEDLTEEDEIYEPKKPASEEYFDSPVGKLFTNIGMNLVQEYVQCDLLKMQKRQGEKEKIKNRLGRMTQLTEQSIISLRKNIEESKENNEPFRAKTKRCELCNFKTESGLVMSTHQETPHMKNYSYRCNFCTYTTRVPHEICFHMEAEHAVRARLERAPAYHQCPNCPFEDNSKAKLTRHLLGCAKRFVPVSNLEPPKEWDTPAKLPKLPKNRMLPQGINPAFLAPGSHRGMAAFNHPMLPKQMQPGKGNLPPLLHAPTKNKPIPGLIRTNAPRTPVVNPQLRGMMIRGSPQLQQQGIQLSNNSMLQQVVSGQLLGLSQPGTSGFLSKLGLQPQGSSQVHHSMIAQKERSASPQVRGMGRAGGSQPSISITPLPRQNPAVNQMSSIGQQRSQMQQQGQVAGKTSFVICEICDGYIKDLDQLRNHMQWIHKVKIHPKMIYNKPPLNCQKCQFRFFTDQGLERHLLGSHGLVTSSMQDAANKGQDNGRCPLCGKVYQWKLLAHVAKDHNVTLKPAHLSYKCTVCTATFGMYKLFESHVYSAHSVTKSAPRQDRPRGPQVPVKSSGLQVTQRQMSSNSNTFKPLKINDEITIIPQPMANNTMPRSKGSLTITQQPLRRSLPIRNNDDEGIQIIEIDDAPRKNGGRPNGDIRGRIPISETLRKRNLEISLCDSDGMDNLRGPIKRIRQN